MFSTFAKISIFPLKTYPPNHTVINPTRILNFPHPYLSRKSPILLNSCYQRRSSKSSSSQNPSKDLPIHGLILFTFSLILLCFRLFSNAFLPNFHYCWRDLIALSQEAEVKARTYPKHLCQAIVAYEDRRFFSHFGIDPLGISRAVLSFGALGGGSTITQQLVKNSFLRNEPTFSRKMVEMVLAVALERKVSKQGILSTYLSKIYWGHGIYGIESASLFYFGKHPSLLSLGESAMLAGIIPAPELRSPFRDPSRGKTFQARVLKRMVKVGYLDIETALSVVKQCLHLRHDRRERADGLLYLFPLTMEKFEGSNKLNNFCNFSTFKCIWDWKKESKTWEAFEDMETWAAKIQHETQPKSFNLKVKMNMFMMQMERNKNALIKDCHNS